VADSSFSPITGPPAGPGSHFFGRRGAVILQGDSPVLAFTGNLAPSNTAFTIFDKRGNSSGRPVGDDFLGWYGVFHYTETVRSGTNFAQVDIEYFTTTGLRVAGHTIELNCKGSGVTTDDTWASDRMRGSIMKITPTFPTATFDCTIYGTNRPFERLSAWDDTQDNASRVLTSHNTQTIAAGVTSGNTYLGMGYGPGTINTYMNGASTDTALLQVQFGILPAPAFNIAMTGNGSTHNDVNFPPRPVRYSIWNQASTSKNFNVTMTWRDW